jgi:hypothetical protein
MMPTKPPPFGAALHLTLAMDALELADEALSQACDSLGEVELQDQGPIDSYDVVGFRAMCRLFVELFGPSKKAMGSRDVHPGLGTRIAERIREHAGSPGNPPGLERAGLALQFAVASLDDAIDALDSNVSLKDPSGDGWYGTCIAARDLFSIIEAAIECGTVRGGVREYFDNGFCFFGRN